MDIRETSRAGVPGIEFSWEDNEPPAVRVPGWVQATLNAMARSQELTVGAAILTGIRSKLIDALEAG